MKVFLDEFFCNLDESVPNLHDELRPKLAEGGSLDEALKARAPSLLCNAPGESLNTAKELSIKFEAKEDAEITQGDAAARERQRQGEEPRSLPWMDFLVVPLPEDVFADFTPTIVVSNAGDDVTASTRFTFHSAW